MSKGQEKIMKLPGESYEGLLRKSLGTLMHPETHEGGALPQAQAFVATAWTWSVETVDSVRTAWNHPIPLALLSTATRTLFLLVTKFVEFPNAKNHVNVVGTRNVNGQSANTAAAACEKSIPAHST